jgi:hypothetical protein
MSEKAPTMTSEANAYRATLPTSTGELFDRVNDLAGDRFRVTSNDRLQLKAGTTAIDEEGNVKNVGGKFTAKRQLEDIAAYEDQIRLGIKAKEAVAALPLIDAALASAYRRATREKKPGQVNELSIIRLNLVNAKIFTALEVGNMTNDEITTLLDYARIAKAQSESEPLNNGEINPDAAAQPAVIDTDTIDPDAAAQPAVIDTDREFDTDDNAIDPDAVAQPAVVDADPINPDAAAQPAVIDIDPTTPASPELQEKLAELNAARAKWAMISSKRQRRTFDRRIEGYNAAKEDYNRLVQEYGRMKLAEQLAAADVPAEKNLLAISYLIQEQNELRDLIKHESDAKWSFKFARWMNEGSRKKRLAKGLLIGLAVGTGGSLLAGAAGAGILAGGAVAASRFVRGYTARHTDGMERLDGDAIQSNAAYRSNLYDGDEFEGSSEVISHYFETDSKKEQAKRRKAFAWGAGSVAVGAVAGHLLHAGIDHVAGLKDHNAFGGHAGAEHHDVAPEKPDNGGVGPADAGDTNPPAPKPQLHEIANIHDTYNVHSGEGWNETMQDMGIPKDKWADVLKDAGPKLHEQGWSYFDNAHGEWRISKPGHLSESAVAALKDASAKNGFTFQ